MLGTKKVGWPNRNMGSGILGELKWSMGFIWVKVYLAPSMGHEWCYRNQTGNMGKRVENEQIGWATKKKGI